MYIFSAPSIDFCQSSSVFSTSNSIARARPRSHTPLIFGPTSTFSKPQMATMPLNQSLRFNLLIFNFFEGITSSISQTNDSSTSLGSVKMRPSAISSSPSSISELKLPIALATNDCIHSWIKRDKKFF